MIGMIAAVSQNGVIGVDNKLPFDYPEDMKHFRTTTANSVVIMGRKTFESIGRPLPKRRNIVISRIGKGLSLLDKADGIETAKSIQEAMDMCADETRNVWFIGGASIYEEAMRFVDKIVLTVTPDMVMATNAVRFPWVNPLKFVSYETSTLTSDLSIVTYVRLNK